ncbi:MAG: hypothetical protein SWH61_06320 [Thermodesulfobacteriota bacterium]|nr:hypothetical protein [Thermodesulfobacteriota bacterium]
MKPNRISTLLMMSIMLFSTAAWSKGPPQQKSSGLSFHRVNEPREGAFSILVPQGWQHQGGIYRVNAAQAGGPLNAMEAKCDLVFKSDQQGTVAFRILPDIVYAHAGIGGRPQSVYAAHRLQTHPDPQTPE